MPPSDGMVERVETALLTICRAENKFSREMEIFMYASCIFLSGSDVLSVVDGCGEPRFMASPVGFHRWTESVDEWRNVVLWIEDRDALPPGAREHGGWCH